MSRNPCTLSQWGFLSLDGKIFADFQNSTDFKDIFPLSTNDRKYKSSLLKSRGSEVLLGKELDQGLSWPFEKNKIEN